VGRKGLLSGGTKRERRRLRDRAAGRQKRGTIHRPYSVTREEEKRESVEKPQKRGGVVSIPRERK